MRQKSFFDHGIMGLIPMTMSDIAKDLSIHESSVSRITTNKYISTPYGLYEMKYFFSSAGSPDTQKIYAIFCQGSIDKNDSLYSLIQS